jgi:hypothetical protein
MAGALSRTFTPSSQSTSPGYVKLSTTFNKTSSAINENLTFSTSPSPTPVIWRTPFLHSKILCRKSSKDRPLPFLTKMNFESKGGLLLPSFMVFFWHSYGLVYPPTIKQSERSDRPSSRPTLRNDTRYLWTLRQCVIRWMTLTLPESVRGLLQSPPPPGVAL